MRKLLAFTTLLIIGIAAFGAGALWAAPLRPLPANIAAVSPNLLQVDYTDRQIRRLQRKGYTVVPPAVAVAPAPGAPVVAAPGAVLVPVKPSSCGEYHYWNGVECVDARYHDPNLGPKP